MPTTPSTPISTPPYPPPPPAAPAANPQGPLYSNQVQGTLPIGNSTLTTCPSFYKCKVVLRFNNPVAYDLTLSITRGAYSLTPGTVQCYSLTLDAGDTIEDTGYSLANGDSIVVNTTVPGTAYFMTLTFLPSPY